MFTLSMVFVVIPVACTMLNNGYWIGVIYILYRMIKKGNLVIKG